MPKLNRKKSKRMTCRKKYKIIKKVAEHNRKLRREAKKNPKRKKAKDPGVPNSVPFKQEILNEAIQRKQRAKELREAQKADRLKLQMGNRNLNGTKETVEDNCENIEESKSKGDEPDGETPFKTLKNVIDLSDVILEVLDARDPIGSRCPEIEKMVANLGKKLILVLNKVDLIPRPNLYSWLTYLRQDLPTIPFKASTLPKTSQLAAFGKIPAYKINKTLKNSNVCIGANFLKEILKNYCQKHDIQDYIKVGVVGFHNVGKKSIIGSLKNYSSGKDISESKMRLISLDQNIKLIPTPAVVNAKVDLKRNVVNVHELTDVIQPAEGIFDRMDQTQLRLHYYLKEFSSCQELLGLLAKGLGKYVKGGEPNYQEGAKRLVSDWIRGIIKYYTNVPEEHVPLTYLSASYTAEMRKEFDMTNTNEQKEFEKAAELFPSKAVSMRSTEVPTEGLLPEA